MSTPNPSRRIHGDALSRLGRTVVGDEALIGLLLDDRYEVVRLIARGGMGAVYLARDVRLDRPVAVKVPAGAAGWTVPPERFREEAVLISRLDHPGIVPLHDLGALPDGQPYFVMKYVDGRTLADVLAGGDRTADLGRRLAILAEAAEIVDTAHRQWIAHRDLKPSNLMVDAADHVYVVDWGIAGVRATTVDGRPPTVDGPRSTASGGSESPMPSTVPGQPSTGSSIVGTPEYMSPEQARGESSGADVRSDVYALGAVLYEILTGRTPASGATTVEVLASAAASRFEPARSVNPSIPGDLAAVGEKAMDPDPARRYGSAGELARDLRRWLAGDPVEAWPAGSTYRIRKKLRKHRTAAVVVALVAAAGAVGTIAFYLPARRAREETERKAQAAREVFDRFQPLALELDRLAERVGGPDAAEAAKVETFVAAVQDRMRQGGAHADGWALIGRAQELLAETALAGEAYQKGLALDPEHPDCRLLRARIRIERTWLEFLLGSDEDGRWSVMSRFQQAFADVESSIGQVRNPSEGAVLREVDRAVVEAWRSLLRECVEKAGPSDLGPPETVETRKNCEAGISRWVDTPADGEFRLIRALASPADPFPDLDAAIQKRPRSARAFLYRGIFRYRRLAGLPAGGEAREAERRDALRDAETALEFQPRLAEALLLRALLREGSADASKARGDYDRAIEMRKPFPLGRVFRALHLLGQDNPKAAVKDLEVLLTVEPRNELGLLYRGKIRLGWEKWPGAAKDLTEAIALNPDQPAARLLRAEARRGLVKSDPARRDLHLKNAEADLAAALKIVDARDPGWPGRTEVEEKLRQVQQERGGAK